MAAKVTVEINPEKTATFYAYKDLAMSERITSFILKGRDFSKQVDGAINFYMRDDDVFLATYPKAGTHWAWEVMTMLINGSCAHATTTKEAVFLDLHDQAKMPDIPSPRVINSHFTPRCIPKDVVKKGIKVVHVYRNPKDVVVSMYNHFKKVKANIADDFDTYFKFFIGKYGIYNYTSWAHYMKEWEWFAKQHPQQILGVYFEDMKEDPVREILKINEFLGCNRGEDLVKDIADACSFDNMRQASENKTHEERGPPTDLIFRKGDVGDWKNWLTVAQNEQIDEWLAENFTNTDYKFRYTL